LDVAVQLGAEIVVRGGGRGARRTGQPGKDEEAGGGGENAAPAQA
jgi:hypothetical protein